MRAWLRNEDFVSGYGLDADQAAYNENYKLSSFERMGENSPFMAVVFKASVGPDGMNSLGMDCLLRRLDTVEVVTINRIPYSHLGMRQRGLRINMQVHHLRNEDGMARGEVVSQFAFESNPHSATPVFEVQEVPSNPVLMPEIKAPFSGEVRWVSGGQHKDLRMTSEGQDVLIARFPARAAVEEVSSGNVQRGQCLCRYAGTAVAFARLQERSPGCWGNLIAGASHHTISATHHQHYLRAGNLARRQWLLQALRFRLLERLRWLQRRNDIDTEELLALEDNVGLAQREIEFLQALQQNAAEVRASIPQPVEDYFPRLLARLSYEKFNSLLSDMTDLTVEFRQQLLRGVGPGGTLRIRAEGPVRGTLVSDTDQGEYREWCFTSGKPVIVPRMAMLDQRIRDGAPVKPGDALGDFVPRVFYHNTEDIDGHMGSGFLLLCEAVLKAAAIRYGQRGFMEDGILLDVRMLGTEAMTATELWLDFEPAAEYLYLPGGYVLLPPIPHNDWRNMEFCANGIFLDMSLRRLERRRDARLAAGAETAPGEAPSESADETAAEAAVEAAVEATGEAAPAA